MGKSSEKFYHKGLHTDQCDRVAGSGKTRVGKERLGRQCTKPPITGDIKQWLEDPHEDEEEDSGNTESYNMRPGFRFDCVSSVLPQPPFPVTDNLRHGHNPSGPQSPHL